MALCMYAWERRSEGGRGFLCVTVSIVIGSFLSVFLEEQKVPISKVKSVWHFAQALYFEEKRL